MKKVIVLTIAALLACAGPSFGGDGDTQTGKVKGSKSNTSERLGAQEAAAAAAEAEQPDAAKSGGKPKGGERPEDGSTSRGTVKSGKSNSSD